MANLRPAAVAGMFYPADADQLAAEITTLLSAVATEISAVAPKALIVPHAGYIYSGAVAASAYALLRPLRGQIQRVLLLGPTHRVAVHGLALPSCQAFATPLGNVALDNTAVAALASLAQVIIHDGTHVAEHSLEVQLPFLQTVLGKFALVPLAVGMATAEQVAEVLDCLWGGPETLIVISSDLSHYHPYQEARELDRRAAERVLALEGILDHDQACGATPINGLLLSARRHHLQVRLLDLRNSGDTAGSRAQVVGYGAFAFTASQAHTLH